MARKIKTEKETGDVTHNTYNASIEYMRKNWGLRIEMEYKP